MPLPPNYYPVYPFQVRLPEPGFHANPIIQTPPMWHVEGLHFLRWAFTDQSKLTTTVSGDYQSFALRNFDTGSMIPHLPLPLTAGPFLAETWSNSKYVILFHQPNVQMDGKPVGVFFWGAAPPWRCFELKLPIPKFLAKRSVGAAARKAQRAAARAVSAQERIGKLEEALRSDDIGPEEYHATEQKIAAEKKALPEHMTAVHKEAEAYPDARKFADDVDEKEFHREREAAKKERGEKHEADIKARSARADADRDEAQAKAIYRREIGAPGGAGGTVAEAEAHETRAAGRRIVAVGHDEKARQHDAAARAHQERAKELRKNRRTRSQREESGRQYQKHGEKRNPYKDATGAGNVKVAMPSLLGHVPVLSTVQIYMSWTAMGKNLLRAALSSILDLLKGYIGFVFDNLLPQGDGKAAWAMDFAKGLATGTAIDAAQKYILEERLSIKLTHKQGKAAVSIELKRDLKTGEWGWKAAIKPTEDSGQPAGAEVQVDYKDPIKIGGQFHPELTPAFLSRSSSGTAPPAATQQPTPAATPHSPPAPPPAPEPSYACTVDNPPVDYSSGPALSGAPAP